MAPAPPDRWRITSDEERLRSRRESKASSLESPIEERLGVGTDDDRSPRGLRKEVFEHGVARSARRPDRAGGRPRREQSRIGSYGSPPSPAATGRRACLANSFRMAMAASAARRGASSIGSNPNDALMAVWLNVSTRPPKPTTLSVSNSNTPFGAQVAVVPVGSPSTMRTAVTHLRSQGCSTAQELLVGWKSGPEAQGPRRSHWHPGGWRRVSCEAARGRVALTLFAGRL